MEQITITTRPTLIASPGPATAGRLRTASRTAGIERVNETSASRKWTTALKRKNRFPISEAGYLLATGIYLKERSSMKGDGRRKQHNMTRHPRMLEPSATHMRAGIPLAIARTFCHYATGAV
ncbi:hypothetical protein C343_05842 [Cryptococcus neoformans C23]|uniref:Uncharacterized protein n=2 Tax=Cryptococcus neoformans TaxID=5207 RepID=A0A854Q9F9_CRYNE|nr:hypothetical protein CNAG_07587 [Cryptococcus neoformans var. grubii H99]AUB27745.1 hypothetical protein CKF44_07587 [Cryptococcus neoformans var. grubii]OWZ27457.1 hypothetical protein C347_05881 [Cryptococcus neoformans var. grubii AD2-60a]OWZ32809.1 hypothetical protein C353_05741 [Cryptococcus neoformans var. grubii AD1-83a]OWZ39761.1 hypothetical protein C343_05842 [Cryptococcus neoformans var. grubii C23]OWZ50840.1 hypothetical protein C368_05996 [Cryptococcus neoformans var. grubii 1|eukprot:XP_012052918.1 hypothetical protein CNAG_07587 [Cryptococcus neoformans var. grubii H99]